MAEKQQQDEEQPKGSKKTLIFIIVGVLLLVGVSIGVTLMLLGGDDSTEDMAEEQAALPQKGDASYIELKPFTVNLDPQDPVGFLQIQIQILTYYSDVAAELEKHRPLIRNNLTLLFGQQKSSELRSPEGKQLLQQKVLESVQEIINKYGSGGEVDNVFFTTFVMQ